MSLLSLLAPSPFVCRWPLRVAPALGARPRPSLPPSLSVSPERRPPPPPARPRPPCSSLLLPVLVLLLVLVLLVLPLVVDPRLVPVRRRAAGAELAVSAPHHGAPRRRPEVHQVPAARLQPALLGLYVLVGAGALMVTVGLFGCCGAVRESQCLLGSFFTCLLVIFAAEVTIGVFAFLGKGMAIHEVQAMYEEAYNEYLKDEGKGNQTLIAFHSSLQCCGKGSPEHVQPTCPKELQRHKNCLVEIHSVIDAKLQLVGIVGIGIASVTIFGMISSMVLCCAIRSSRDII
uniref:Tetraspanin-2 n=1 Tax=Ornithorhynchus anatinus TaxID=9258 RepID=A0A6I8PGP8_ORNAN